MLGDVSQVEHIYLACGYTDLRRGIDGLAQIVQQQFSLDPFSNSLFLFCGRRRDRIKALLWEGDGFVLLYKRMANWIIRCAEDHLEPLWEAMHEELLRREVVHADETVVQVLKENGRTDQSKSYMWVYRTGQDRQLPIILYEYQPGRSGEYPKRFLEGFLGYLHTDGYAGYNQMPGITRCGCFEQNE